MKSATTATWHRDGRHLLLAGESLVKELKWRFFMSGRTNERHTESAEVFIFWGEKRQGYKIQGVSAKRLKAWMKSEALFKNSHAQHKMRGISAIPSMNEGFAKRGYGACALAAARFNAGYTQDFLASATGIRQPHLSAMENGKRPIGETAAKRLGIALECDWRDFVRI